MRIQYFPSKNYNLKTIRVIPSLSYVFFICPFLMLGLKSVMTCTSNMAITFTFDYVLCDSNLFVSAFVLQKMDLNKDGVISLEEFMDTCRTVSNKQDFSAQK